MIIAVTLCWAFIGYLNGLLWRWTARNKSRVGVFAHFLVATEAGMLSGCFVEPPSHFIPVVVYIAVCLAVINEDKIKRLLKKLGGKVASFRMVQINIGGLPEGSKI